MKKNSFGQGLAVFLVVIGIFYIIGAISEASEPKCIKSGCDNKQATNSSYCYLHKPYSGSSSSHSNSSYSNKSSSSSSSSSNNNKSTAGSNASSYNSSTKKSSTGTSSSKKSNIYDSYDDGYDDIYMDGDYDYDRYDRDNRKRRNTKDIWTVLSESVSGRPARSRNWLIPCKRDHSGTKGVYKSDIKERKRFYIFCVSSNRKE